MKLKFDFIPVHEVASLLDGISEEEQNHLYLITEESYPKEEAEKIKEKLQQTFEDSELLDKLYEKFQGPILGAIEFLEKNQRTKHDEQNGQIVHLLDGYIKDLELLDRLLPTSAVANKDVLAPAVKEVLQRLYKIREAKP